MKDSMGNAFLFYIILTFVAIFVLLITSSAAYSKAYKIKNSIIEEIEQNDGKIDDAIGEVDKALAGQYRVGQGCDSITIGGTSVGPIDATPNFDYCVYKITDGNGCYYRVEAYLRLDIPLIGKFIRIPTAGETKTFMSC